jgi:methionine--tRNA ligase beta chain
MIKNIIFDWSGVINDDLVTVHCAIMGMFKEFGVKELSLEEFKQEWEQPHMRFYNRYGLFTKGGEKKNIEEEIKLYRACYKSALVQHPIKPFPHIKETLQDLKKAGIKMIVISSNLRETLLSDIEEFGLQGIFNEINSEVHDKAEDIAETIKRNKFNPEETVFVGDTPHEVQAGKSAGIKTVAVTWGFSKEDKLKAAKPDYIVHNLKELEDIILTKIISYEDFQKLDIRIGKIISAERVVNSDKLLKLEVDFGEEKRQIVSGIAEYFEPESLIGKEAPFVINLEPRVLKGVESTGMIMAMRANDKVVLLQPSEEVPPGSIVK